MALRRAFKMSTIIIIVLLVISAVAFLLDYLSILPVSRTVQKVPIVGRLAAKEETVEVKDTAELIAEAVSAEKKTAALETDRYKKKIGQMDQQTAVMSKEKQLLEAKNQGLQTKVDELQAWKNEQQQQQVPKADYTKLASFYAEMKPAKAAEIMKNLSDEMNIGILQNLEPDQTAKILSAMEPVEAARLVEIMNGGKVQ